MSYNEFIQIMLSAEEPSKRYTFPAPYLAKYITDIYHRHVNSDPKNTEDFGFYTEDNCDFLFDPRIAKLYINNFMYDHCKEEFEHACKMNDLELIRLCISDAFEYYFDIDIG